jgi:DUF1680 family protein
MMGAANTLRWQEHSELQRRMDAIVDGIAECRQSDGYIMAYPEDSIMHSERAGYTRAWVTHGLLEAGYTGYPKAFELLRGYYDWFDRCQYLPKLLRGTAQGVQGMVANTRMYFSPVGRPEDIQVVQRYFQENYWLDGLARRDGTMIWQYPYDRPHNYLLTDIEAYFDLYRATGASRYKDAAAGRSPLPSLASSRQSRTGSKRRSSSVKPENYVAAASGHFSISDSIFWIPMKNPM